MAYTNDNTYKAAVKRIFSTNFFNNNLSYRSKLLVADKPVFLSNLAITPDDLWKIMFYNTKIDINFNETIIVDETKYDYYNNMPNEKKFYYYSIIEPYNRHFGIYYTKYYVP